MNRLAATISEARKKAGLSEKELAKKCGLSVSYLMQVESGKKIINEKVGEKILKALGVQEKYFDEEKPVPEPKKADHRTKPVPVDSIIVEPTESWMDALSGLIKKYPVYDVQSGKVVDFRELPLINKKVAGIHPDKLLFVKASDNDMKFCRIEKEDILTVNLTKEIINGGIYLLEYEGHKLIRRIKKEGSKLLLSKSINDGSFVTSEPGQIGIIGRVVRIEIILK
ncbi:MAG: helix-turn-helix domain-containing protein [Dehalobacterium sp.]